MENSNPFSITKDSPILITGAAGFIGKNLAANLRALGYCNLLEYDMSSSESALAEYTARAAFVFHLAGINRPQNKEDFYSGNSGLTQQIIQLLQQHNNPAPVLLTSSAQAGNGSDYAISKEQAEATVFNHMKTNNSPVFIFRLDGVFGKWSRPSYNSVVATFCHNIAHDIPVEILDASFQLPLCYIDDVIDDFIAAMLGKLTPPALGEFAKVNTVHTISLGELAQTIQRFKTSRDTLDVPFKGNALEEKLYATYLSYLPENSFAYPLTMHCDERGSFTEFIRTPERGQVSINISKPGIVKGNHWHNTKNEKFLVVQGEAMIRFRKVGTDEIIEYPVSGNKLTVVDIPTGYTHNIENIGTGELVTVMWASQPFNPDKPDTYFEKV